MASRQIAFYISWHLGVFSCVTATVGELRIVRFRFSTLTVGDNVIYGAVIKRVYFIVTEATGRRFVEEVFSE